MILASENKDPRNTGVDCNRELEELGIVIEDFGAIAFVAAALFVFFIGGNFAVSSRDSCFQDSMIHRGDTEGGRFG